jgi:predicted neuraminidase
MRAIALIALLSSATLQAGGAPMMNSELIFPLENVHNHSSSIVELPDGDLLVCWFHGSGERTADDTLIQAARWSKTGKTWGERFTIADTPDFPDTNPVLFVDSKQKLFLFWPAIIANEWYTALMKYKVSTDYEKQAGPPKWDYQDNVLMKPLDLGARAEAVFAKDLKHPGPFAQRAARVIALANDKYFSRMGWFTRSHPLELPSGRILLPLYSDGYSFSLVGISDDGGLTWKTGGPIIGYGNIQPSIVRKKDGTLVAYMRDNGPRPKRAHISTSNDDGMTWTPAVDSELYNPGTSLEVTVLADGNWLIVYNDIESKRYSLVAALSDDEGKTWRWTRHLDGRPDRASANQYHYPSVIQAKDGSIHVTYSYFALDPSEPVKGKSIKHVHLNEAWIQAGDPNR